MVRRAAAIVLAVLAALVGYAALTRVVESRDELPASAREAHADVPAIRGEIARPVVAVAPPSEQAPPVPTIEPEPAPPAPTGASGPAVVGDFEPFVEPDTAKEEAQPAAAPIASPDASSPALWIPVDGIAASDLSDTFSDARGAGRVHDAIDIMAPRGTRVRAAADGRVVKLFTSVPGGLTVYQFDATETYVLYYAHLDSYAPDLAEGQVLARGDPIGRVGSTGNASAAAPHLHFSVNLLGPEKRWWEGTPINPYPLLKNSEPASKRD